MEKLSTYVKLIKSKTYSSANRNWDAIVKTVSAAIGALLMLGLFIVDISHNNITAAVLSATMFVGCVLIFLITYIKKKVIAASVMFCILLAVFSVYALLCSNEGFSVTWYLFVPTLSMAVLGLKYGFACSAYYMIFCYVVFHSSISDMLVNYYSTTFIKRFPYLYTCDFIIVTILFIQWEYMHDQMKKNEDDLEKAIKEERRKVTNVSMQTILSISNAVDAKDKYTRQHSQRVADYSIMIASKLGGWSRERIQQLHEIALLHDIGKIGVSDAILRKPGRLTDEEYEQMKQHTVLGGEILKDLTILPNVASGAKYHHERYDGKGYPQGLKGEEIPIEARIIGIADAFDAMNSTRVYREKRSGPYIYNELIKGRGTQFDPVILDAFLPIALELLQNPYQTQ